MTTRFAPALLLITAHVWSEFPPSAGAAPQPPKPPADQVDAHDRTRKPRVRSITPPDNAQSVDPDLSRIRIVFDMPMSPVGFSFAPPDDDRRLPNITGPPVWQDAYTLLLPVRLTTHTAFGFVLNGNDDRNFRSVWLTPAEPFSYRFTTGGVADVHRAPDAQRRVNLESFDALADAIRTKNAHLDARDVPWENLFAEHRRRIIDQPDLPTWTRSVARMLAAAGDPNIWLELDGRVFTTCAPPTSPVPADAVRAALLADFNRIEPRLATARTLDGIAYLEFAGFPESIADPKSPWIGALTDCRDATAVIIDLRANTGDNPRSAESIARWFVRTPAVYCRYDLRRGPGPQDFSPKRSLSIRPNPVPRRIHAPVAVLIGPNNRSTAESFALMMRYAANATLIGRPTAGASGNSQPVYLPNGVKLYLPAWRLHTPDGAPLENVGVQPDILATPTPDTDTPLARALDHLRAVARQPDHP